MLNLYYKFLSGLKINVAHIDFHYGNQCELYKIIVALIIGLLIVVW